MTTKIYLHIPSHSFNGSYTTIIYPALLFYMFLLDNYNSINIISSLTSLKKLINFNYNIALLSIIIIHIADHLSIMSTLLTPASLFKRLAETQVIPHLRLVSTNFKALVHFSSVLNCILIEKYSLPSPIQSLSII